MKNLMIKINLYFLNRKLKKLRKKMNTFDMLENLKKDVVGTLESEKKVNLLITVPDISIRDYFLADPLFKNFYSNRVSFREKKLKHNRMMLCSIERV